MPSTPSANDAGGREQPAPGVRFGPYLLEEQLGKGGMGVVFRATDTNRNAPVALKFIAPQVRASDEAYRRFLREAQAAARLDHPNICKTYGLEDAYGPPFLVMAYLEGETLQHRLARTTLPLRQAVEIALEIARGLQQAHENDIVHRDIKPANIFLRRDGPATITDFGLACLTDRSRITRDGTVMGTIQYMSPEQLRAEPVDRRSDIWSLGVVLFEMIDGRGPFARGDMQSVARAILNEHPPRLSEAGDVEAIVRKALAKSPGERYQNVDDMIVDLRTLLPSVSAGEPRAPRTRVGARTDTPTETMLVPAGVRAPRAARSAAAAIATLSLLTIVWWLMRT